VRVAFVPGEAEYVVTMFQYMRLLGYPAKKISIITSYRGQKCLIRDIINARCASNPLFGKPAKVRVIRAPHRAAHSAAQ
jgi:intron-binding protein aquarius